VIALSAQALAQKALDGVNCVWMLDAAFDEFGLATEDRRWGTRAYTIGVYTYSDLLSVSGLDISESSLSDRGGLATVGGLSFRIRDEEDESALTDEYVVVNDPVVLTQVFVSGAEVLADRFELVRGVIERHSIEDNEWLLTVKDDSKSLLRDFPVETLNPALYPYAYDPGQIIPQAFGHLNHGPDDGDGLSAVLAPVRVLDKYTSRGTAGWRNNAQADVYQWYQGAGVLAKVVNSTDLGDGSVTVDGPERVLVLRPIRPADTNDVADYVNAIDGNTATDATLVLGDDLDVYLAGAPALGRMTGITLVIVATGDYTLSVYDGADLKNGPSALNGNQSYALTLADWESWQLAFLKIAVDGPGAGSTQMKDLKVSVEFDDYASFTTTAPSFWQAIAGYEDQAANYVDGAVIAGAGTVLRNPVHQLQAIMRDTNFLTLPTAKVVSGWVAAAASRTTWLFDWAINIVGGEDFLGNFCFQAGLHLFPEAGGFSVAAMDKLRTPQHFFSGDWHMPALNGESGDPSTWGDPFQVQPVDASEIINEANIRYRYHGPSGDYRKQVAATGQYRLSGTCTLTAVGVFEDLGASFMDREVRAGERIYISGDVNYIVTADAASQTQLQVSPEDGGPSSTITAPTAYYLGPNVDGVMLVSQLSYKRVQALGTQQVSFLDDGGYTCPFIVDDDTAGYFLSHVKDWFAFPRDIVTFQVHHTGVDVQLGDVLMLDHWKLRASKRPVAMTVLDGDHISGATTWSVATGTAGLLRADDYVLVIHARTFQPLVAKVTAVDLGASTVDVDVPQLGTVNMALEDGWTIYRLTVKWMVVGLRPMTPIDPYIRIRAVQMPNSYYPVGRVVVAGYPDAGAATPEQLVQSGWATLRNGRIWDLDPNSAISYTGPDSGTYTIV